MDYTYYINVEGTNVEIEVDVDDEYIYNYVTEDNCSVWATDHFKENADVDEFVKDWLEELSEDDLMKLVAPMLGII